MFESSLTLYVGKMFLLAFFFSVICIRLFILFSEKIGFVSKPNALVETHKQPVALGGGIVLAVLIIMFILLSKFESKLNLITPVVLLPVFIMGIVDDIFHIKAIYKLSGQLIAALMYVLLANPPILYFPLIILFILASQNAWNLIDIMDGLIGLISIICFGAISVIGIITFGHLEGYSYISLISTAAIAGFIIWNYSPAKIYLGETGASVLGTLFSLLIVHIFSLNLKVGLTLGLIGIIPFFEMIFLIIVRAKKAIPLFKGSPDHFALRLLNKGLPVPKIIGLVGIVNVIIALNCIFIAVLKFNLIILLIDFIMVVFASFIAFRYFASLSVREIKK